LERRLPVLGTNDDLGQLNRAFNGLLDRLQESFERQRRFTVEASHQLRTPLAGILGQLEVALRRERPVEEYQRVLSTVHRRGSHLTRIVESLLFLSRANAEASLAALEGVCLNSWLPEQIEAWCENKRAGDMFFVCRNSEAAFVRAHPALLGELLSVLVDNACKFSAPGSPIEIALDCDGREALIQVTDRGRGISEADLRHLFAPFFRSEDARRHGIEGTGLGLSIARRLARLFGGDLSVTSQLGFGSCFSLRLPLALPESAEIPVRAAPECAVKA
jgi:signal transduction histidine kinase